LELVEGSRLEVNSAIISDPGEPISLKAAIYGYEKVKWIDAVKKEINNNLSGKVWNNVSRRVVVIEQKRKRMTTKWILKKMEQDKSI
jgi:hypothetical protein